MKLDRVEQADNDHEFLPVHGEFLIERLMP
jgi:hypothetical protein